MKIEHLKVFVEVAQSESINKAAGKLFTSHQNLNVLLKKMEEELNTTLFIRSNKGIVLSEDGKELLNAATQIISIFDQFQNTIKKETGVLNFYTTTSLASITNDLQGRSFCNNYISIYKENVDELYSMIETNKKGVYFVAVTKKNIKKLEQHKDHIIIAKDSHAVRIYHKNNPKIQNLNSHELRAITNITQSQFAQDALINIDDLNISKKLMREEAFVFVTSESLAKKYFPEDEWIYAKEEHEISVVYFTVFFNLPTSAEWHDARNKIAEYIRTNFNTI